MKIIFASVQKKIMKGTINCVVAVLIIIMIGIYIVNNGKKPVVKNTITSDTTKIDTNILKYLKWD